MAAAAEVQAALNTGIGALHAWAEGEKNKARALHQQKVASVGGNKAVLDAAAAKLHAATEELKRAPVAPTSLPHRFFGLTVVLKNYHNQHLSSPGPAPEGKGRMEAGTGAGEQWCLEDAGDGWIFLSNPAHDVRISASDNKDTTHMSKNRDGWEKWQVIDAAPHGGAGKYCFISAHGTSLSQNDGGVLYQSPNKSGWEHWEIIPVGGAHPAAVARGQFEAQHQAAVAEHQAANAAYEHEVKTARAHADQELANTIAHIDAEVSKRVAAKQAQAAHLSAAAQAADHELVAAQQKHANAIAGVRGQLGPLSNP